MTEIIEGSSLKSLISDFEHNKFKNEILNQTLPCQNIERVSNGDTRFWGVPPESNIALNEFFNFACKEYELETGKRPKKASIMINYIDSEKCPIGSGNGWHRDSWKNQYKAFMYLNDVDQIDQGAFAFVKNSNFLFLKIISLINRIIYRGNRYSNKYISILNKLGFQTIPILKKAYNPFFLNTSQIHRGLEIKNGFRMMATVYLFEDISTKIKDNLIK